MEDLRTIGIPKGLLYYKYGELWQVFLDQCGFEVVLSQDSDRSVMELGDAVSMDECCMASKIYMGHVASLIDRCDAVFVPCYDNCDVRAGFCTKYQSLPDLVRATFRDRGLQVVSLRVPKAMDKKKTRSAFVDLATSLGLSPARASKAWKLAAKAQNAADAKRAAAQQEAIKLIASYKKVVQKDKTGTEEAPLTILLMAHPYIAHDDYIAGDVMSVLERMGALVLHADEYDHAAAFKKSFSFSDTLPWIISRELVGAMLELKDDVDGIVIMSAFPCGPDSMFDDAIMRSVKGIPILNLMIDATSGTAGMETRVESFVDILRFQDRGSYLHE